MTHSLLIYIILAPLTTGTIIGFFYLAKLKGLAVPRLFFAILACLGPIVSFCITLDVFLDLWKDPSLIYIQKAFTWLSIGGIDLYFDILADRLSIFMSLFISFIGALIHLYATGYMACEEGFGKFFCYFNLFLVSMLLLVLGNNPILLFIGWEGVGLCSYLLISYYYHNKEFVQAGNKAFYVNRVGDFGFIIGLSLLFILIGDGGFDYASLAFYVDGISQDLLILIGICLFIGAMGKSAQIPLYVWLADAMAGPTPVSALIHAATMVTAGVYMIARFDFVYDLIPNIGLFIAYIGCFSALFAGILATQQTDIKKILAYSTMSQLGYMFVAVGLGAYGAGLFHMLTHAFFKALLFLAAGSVIFALHHEQNIFNMGNLRKKLPLTFMTMAIGFLALLGLPPFAGFFSKDAIMMATFDSGHYMLWVGLFITIGFTAYYMSRLMIIAFISPTQQEYHHLEKQNLAMQIVLIILAIGSVIAGFIGIPSIFTGSDWLANTWFSWDHELKLSHSTEYLLIFANFVIIALGFALAYYKFAKMPKLPKLQSSLVKTVYHKFYIDEIYNFVFIKGLQRLSSFIIYYIDYMVIDLLVRGSSKGFSKTGTIIAYLTQNGNSRFYAIYILLGISGMFIYTTWLYL